MAYTAYVNWVVINADRRIERARYVSRELDERRVTFGELREILEKSRESYPELPCSADWRTLDLDELKERADEMAQKARDARIAGTCSGDQLERMWDDFYGRCQRERDWRKKADRHMWIERCLRIFKGGRSDKHRVRC